MAVQILSSSPLPYMRLPFGRRELSALLERMRGLAHDLYKEGLCPFALESVDLLLVDDADMAKENARAMGVAGPTNILSFPAAADGRGSLLLSCETFEREARLYGQEKEPYLVRLLAHGLSHLCGFDHGAQMDAFAARLEAAGSAC